MKVLILTALVVSISAGWLDSWTANDDQVADISTHTKYEPGKEYVYKFESQVLTGLPAFTKSHGGIKVKANVKFDFTSATDGVMQLAECQVLTMNHEIADPVHLPPRKQLPTDKFTPLPSEQARLIQDKLQMPIKFRYTEGKITWIEVTDQETNWSIDLKRSILAMLQVRLQADDSSSNPELEYNDLTKENSTTFSFLEPAMDGTCYSTVSVQHSPVWAKDETHYWLKKSRNPSNCPKLNSVFKVTWNQDISNCRCQPNMEDKMCTCLPTSDEYTRSNPAYFNAQTLTEYKVKSSDKKNFLITHCYQSATYRYEFPNTQHQYLATFSNQTLLLKQQKDEQTINTRDYSFKRVNEPWRHQILELDEEVLMMKPEEVVDQARKLIDELFTISNDKQRFQDHLTVFYQLIENLRLCKRDQLNQIYRQNNVRDQYKKWKIMVDALAHCNTTVCDEFLMDKIASGVRDFPPTESTTVFMLWATNKIPTIPVLNKFKRTVFPALEGKTDQKLAYHHALLCFGSMIRRFIHSEEINKKMCAWEKDREIHQKNIDNCRQFEEYLENKLDAADNDEEKIAVLKSLANLGSMESLPLLQKKMEKTESLGVRIHAIYAVKNLCFQNRMKVLQTITPLLMNMNEDSEIRMAAFICYLMCDPSTVQLHKVIEEERDLDLKTFFVLTLRNELKYTWTDGPNYFRAQKAKMVLSKVKAFQMSADSGNFEIRYGMRPESDGEILSWAWLTNQTSPYPRTAAIQHINLVRGKDRHNFEMGYRVEGLEALFGKMSDKSPSQASHPDLRILDALKPTSRSWNKEEFKPTLTLYIRADHQHMSFVHVDSETITKHMLSAIQHGQMEIPIKVFQTYATKPEQNKKLQPHGMWQVTERINFGVIDIDGTLIIRKPAEGELMPNISFGSEKIFRHEKKTILSQYVKCGFAKAGVTSALATLHYIDEQMWNVSYSLSQKNMTFNVSNPTKDIFRYDMNAYTATFVLPMRVKDIVKEKEHAFKDIVTVDPERLTFDKQIDTFKSVELKAKVEGDVCVPELYTFVRDRLHLMPSMLSIKKQYIKFTLEPATSAYRNYTFTQRLRDMQNELISEWSEQTTPSDWYVESEQKDWSLSDFFGGLFSDKESSEEQIKSLSSDKYDPLKQLRVGSIRTLWQGKIWSRSEHKTLAMVANLTSQYEHDYPTVNYVLSCERPPIPSEERDNVVFRSVASRSFNPSINQVVTKWTVAWGEKSDPTKHTIEIDDEHTAMYKDNVCFEQSAYGCKDQYGVFYPLYFNKTSLFKSENTDLVPYILRLVTPYYMNSADKVLVLPADQQHIKPNEINMTRIYRPHDDMVDVAFMLDNMHWNMSKIYLPVESSLEEIFDIHPMYPLGETRPVAQFLPGHQQINPFFSRDTCVVENTKAMSMDFKQLAMPKSDCELVLIGDCARENKEMMVTLKPQVTDRSVEKKTLKVIIGASKIEIELTPGTSYTSSSAKVMINGQEKYLDANKQLLVKQQEKTVAIVECSDKDQCEIKSGKYGLYVRINDQRVKVEVENGRSRYLCGFCSAHPEVRTDVVDYERSVEIFRMNRKQNEQCDIEEKSEDAKRFYEQQTCNKQYKHKIIRAMSGSELKTCVTTDKLPLCSRYCEQKMTRFDHVPVRCINRMEAQRLDFYPTMEGNEMYLEDEKLLTRMQNAENKMLSMPLSQSCQ